MYKACEAAQVMNRLTGVNEVQGFRHGNKYFFVDSLGHTILAHKLGY